MSLGYERDAARPSRGGERIGPWGAMVLLVLWLVAGALACESPSPDGPAPAAEELCDPAVDLERCDAVGRLQCDAVAKLWIFIGTCEPMTYCIETALESEGPAHVTQCVGEKGAQERP